MGLSNFQVSVMEEYVRTYLYSASAPVTNFDLFTFVQGAGAVTAQQFNRLIADMKRAGVVGTAKGGEVVFLSAAARQQRDRELQQPKVTGGAQ